MDDLYTIIMFVAFIAYSIYRSTQKAKKKAATPQPSSESKPVKELFETLFGEVLDDEPTPRPVPTRQPLADELPRSLKEYYYERQSSKEKYVRPVYDDFNRPKRTSLKTVVQSTKSSSDSKQPSRISQMLKNDENNLRKAIIYQNLLERPYV
jgi:cell division protein FtsN